MAGGTPPGLLLIVTGSSLRAEVADRPLAYYLQQKAGAQFERLGAEARRFRIVVVSDVRWLHQEEWQSLPVVSVGGPGVNLVARKWLEEMPVSMAVENRFFIQMDPELTEPRASVWGMNNSDTQIAVETFVQRFLPRLLDHCVRHAADFATLGTDGEFGQETESDD
jgi:hypothetical protein